MKRTGTLKSICAACKTPGTLEVSQLIVDGTLRWSEQFSCTCGHGFEASGAGVPSAAAREAVIAASGRFTVWVDAITPSKRAQLDDALHAFHDDPHALLERLPACVHEGSEVEAELLTQTLSRCGATLRSERRT